MKDLETFISDLPEISQASKEGILDIVKEGIRNAAEDWKEKVTEKDNQIAKAEETIKELESKMAAADDKVSEMAENLKALTDAAEAKVREERYQDRMVALTEEFDLTDEERQRITSKARDLDEEAYQNWYEDFCLFANSKKKEVIEASQKEIQQTISDLEKKLEDVKREKEEAEAKAKEGHSAASVAEEVESEADETLENALEEENQSVANAQTPSESEESLEEQLKKFRESIDIKY